MASKLPYIGDINSCPKCGHDEWYQKEKYSGYYEFRHRFDGEEIDNEGIYDHAVHVLTSKFAYCNKCHSKIGRLEP